MRKFFKVLLICVLVLLIAGIAGGYWFVKNFDLNKYKEYAAKIVEEQTGRKFAINGDASLGISLVPTLIVEDVALANASWATHPQMVTVEKLELKLSILPLLKKQIVLDKVLLVRPEVYLEVSNGGEANWDFSPQKAQITYKSSGWLIKSAQAQEVAVIASDTNIADMIKGFSAQSISIEDGIVQFNDNKNKTNLNLALKKINLSAPSFDDDIKLGFDVVYNGQNIKGQAQTASLNKILADKESFPLKLVANAYGVDAQLDGTLSAVMSDNPKFDFKSNIYNPAGNFGAPETTLISRVKGDTKIVAVAIESLNVVNNLIAGDIKVDIAGKVPYIAANLQSNGIDLTSLQSNQPLAYSFGLPELVSSVSASELVPDTAIPYNELKAVNADVNLKIGNLIINDAMSAQNVLLKAALKNGVLNVDPLKMNFGGGEIDVKAALNANTQGVVLTANSKNVLLQKLHKEFLVQGANDFGIKEGGQVDININLKGNGKTYRSLVNSLDGQVIAIADKSVVQTGALNFMTGNFISELLNALNLNTQKSTDINLNCAVVRADFGNGKVAFPKGIAMSSEQLNLVSNGDVNLVNDKINFTLRPFSGKVVDTNVAQAISSFLAIKGTLQNPKIALDDKEALGALVGIAATGGVSYLGSKMLLDVDSSPCYTALLGTAYQNRFPKPTGVAATGQEVYQDTSKAIKDDLKNLKNSAKDILKGLSGAMKGNM